MRESMEVLHRDVGAEFKQTGSEKQNEQRGDYEEQKAIVGSMCGGPGRHDIRAVARGSHRANVRRVS